MDSCFEDLAQEQTNFCHLFSNEKRVMILWALQACYELSVGDLAQTIDTSLQNTSQHLRLLKKHDIVTSRRDGHKIYYRLNQPQETKCGLLDPKSNGPIIKLFNKERSYADQG